MRKVAYGVFSGKKSSSEASKITDTESGGFEPPVRCRTHAFQACTFSHSVNSPSDERPTDLRMTWQVTTNTCNQDQSPLASLSVAGSCATSGPEPPQVRKEARVGMQRVCCRVPGGHFFWWRKPLRAGRYKSFLVTPNQVKQVKEGNTEQ